MKYWLLALFFVASAFGATAPDSISGKVFRNYQQWIFNRTSSESTVVFGQDGRFTYLKAGKGSPFNLANPWKIFLEQPRSDGTYKYVRTDDTTGAVTMNFDDGTTAQMVLQFSSATGGTDSSFQYSSFTLSDLRGGVTDSVSNVSMRGHVDANHPLIVGFVVPGLAASGTPGGTPLTTGNQQREVLIRVVGPSLAQLGITTYWADPNFTLYQGANPAQLAEVHYDDWAVEAKYTQGTPQLSPGGQAAFQKIFNYVGAFPLIPGSKDSADVVRLNPGAYTIVASPAASDPGGECLVEVYFLP